MSISTTGPGVEMGPIGKRVNIGIGVLGGGTVGGGLEWGKKWEKKAKNRCKKWRGVKKNQQRRERSTFGLNLAGKSRHG